MIRRTLASAFAAFALLCSLLASPAEARREWQAFGGGGDATTKIECPAGQVLAGFQTQTGDWIGQLRIMCAPLKTAFSTGDAQGFGGFFGARAGQSQQALCPSDSVMGKLAFNLTADKGKVVVISLGCVRASGEMTGASLSGNGEQEKRCGKALGLIPQGCPPGEGFRIQTCPNEQFVGLTIHSGRDVNAIGVICDRRDPPPPPPPPKPIHTTGKPRVPAAAPAPAKATGPPLALRATISGSWKMTVGDQRGNLILAAQGPGLDPFSRDTQPLPVGGQLINPDDDAASGGVQGVLEASRMLTLNYFRKNGTTGTCQLLYESDGKSLRGSCVENGHTVEWGGFRGAWKAAAVAPAAAGSPAAGGQSVAVKLDVDLYAAPGGAGDAAGSLAAGTQGVTLIEPCKGDWCHVRWPGHEGWVYSGSDYNSLGR